MHCEVVGGHVVVTGGANGIGAALAHEAANRGASAVSIVDIDAAGAAAVAADIENSTSVATGGYGCDVSSAAAVEELAGELVSRHGLPTLVCANAGVAAPTAPVLDTPPETAEWILGINVGGVLHTLQSFGRLMAADEGGGWLMATGSEHSLGIPHLNGGLYTASKHAVLGMCDVMRRELPPHVGVSVLCPGLTASKIWRAGERRPDDLGGPVEPDAMAGAFMESAGMPAATVAERAFDGLADGQFLIPTHYNARAYAEARATEAAEAFDRLAAVDTTDYDMGRLIAEMFANLEADEDGTDAT